MAVAAPTPVTRNHLRDLGLASFVFSRFVCVVGVVVYVRAVRTNEDATAVAKMVGAADRITEEASSLLRGVVTTVICPHRLTIERFRMGVNSHRLAPFLWKSPRACSISVRSTLPWNGSNGLNPLRRRPTTPIAVM